MNETIPPVVQVFVIIITLFILGTFAAIAFLLVHERNAERPRVPKIHNRWPGI